mmetsp:Transcript_18291/g.40496  ORF Transcript_18291/g.40496 Transcript_18291/m.40496 type:complete len:211 (-) Transcript_18291:565-1197(-)
MAARRSASSSAHSAGLPVSSKCTVHPSAQASAATVGRSPRTTSGGRYMVVPSTRSSSTSASNGASASSPASSSPWPSSARQSPSRSLDTADRCFSTSSLAPSVKGLHPPKSVSFRWLALVTTMFSGLRSPYTKPESWIAQSADTTSPIIKRTVGSSNDPLEASMVWRSPLAAYSNTKYAPSRHLNDDTILAMFGCDKVRRMVISRFTDAS